MQEPGTGDGLSSKDPTTSTNERERVPQNELSSSALQEVTLVDPELLNDDENSRLIELGIRFCNEVTEAYGTPKEPKLSSGRVEKRVPMTYHNGGSDGHTSIGSEGVGVPRNALMIAQRVNDVAGAEIFDTRMRAIAFYASMAHDRIQLCGRALMSEGQGDGLGDERLTAELARKTYVADIVGISTEELTEEHENQLTRKQKENDNLIEKAVMATAFDTSRGSQNVVYKKGWTYHQDRLHDTDTQEILMQELVAAADLLGPSSLRGPLGAIEYCVEQLALKDKGQLLQQELGDHLGEDGRVFTSHDMSTLLRDISSNEILRKKFTELVNGQIQFFSTFLNYSDTAIRATTQGKGIKELFPGLEENANTLKEYYAALTSETADPLQIWESAHTGFKNLVTAADGAVYLSALPQAEFVSPPITDEEKAYNVCLSLREKFPTIFRGAYQFGTPGGADLDLRLCFKDTLPTETEQDQIRQEFQALNLGVDVDILFIEEQELLDGKIADLTQFSNAEAHLQYGFDPHYQQAAVGDTSMFSAYIFATMQPFYEETNQRLVTPEIALQNLRLSRDGAVGWTHYYTGAFLSEYKHYKENSDLSSPAYQKRLAKFFSRVTLGSTLAQLTPEQLEQLQPQLIDAIKEADQTTSSDEKMANVLLENVNTRFLLSEEDQELLRIAGDIRSGTVTDFSEEFVRRAESMLFYNAYQQGIERRFAPGQEVDYLTSYAFEMLARNPTFGARVETLHEGQQLITQGTTGESNFYYIPVTEDTPGVKIEVQTSTGETVPPRTRVPGSLVGEGPIFGILRRSGTVTALEDGTQVLVIDARVIQNLLADPYTFTALQSEVLQSNDARMADVLLQYFARESGRFVKETLPYTSLSSKDDADTVHQSNPLDQYNLGTEFHDILARYNSKQPDSPVTTISAAPSQKIKLFDQDQTNDKLFVVSEGTVHIRLKTGEEITLGQGEVFGESSILGTPTTGSANLPENSSVLAIDAAWFQKFTQTRQPIENLSTNSQDKTLLPRHLLYHLAYVGYDRVRRRLATQTH